jgi:hypothetical protein
MEELINLVHQLTHALVMVVVWSQELDSQLKTPNSFSSIQLAFTELDVS